MNKVKQFVPDSRMQDIPTYDITIDDDETQGIQFIALVKKPAIGVMGMHFSEQEINIEKLYQFKKIDDKQIIVGPVMIPDRKIIRESKEYGMHYVKFSQDVILQMRDRFFSGSNTNRSIILDHSNADTNTAGESAQAFIQGS